MQLVLWPILAVWMGLAVLIVLGIVGTVLWGTTHMLWDAARGSEGEIWCPVLHRAFRVRGTPRRFHINGEFAALRRCERWGKGRIRCNRPCLLAGLVRAAQPAVA